MIALDKTAFICDMAETYQIYDYTRVPGRLLGTLAAGLRDDSRIGTKLSGLNAPIDTILQAKILDALNLLLWSRSRDGEKGRNRPESYADAIINGPKEREQKTFSSPEEFDKAWQDIVNGGN